MDIETYLSFVVPSDWTLITPSLRPVGHAVLWHKYVAGLILIGNCTDSPLAQHDDALAEHIANNLTTIFPAPSRCADIETRALSGPGINGRSVFFRLDFGPDTPLLTGEVYAAVVHTGAQRWFVGWLGDSSAPVDIEDAQILAESLRPYEDTSHTNAPSDPVLDRHRADQPKTDEPHRTETFQLPRPEVLAQLSEMFRDDAPTR
ncbi:alanine and proline-rich secreted protein Apa [Nocardia sp. NBC_00881]|uniref:APA family fibronectin-binding glycoprotein n=1 Tax=Nocardia sp. NBC_00881 TaxID=2975995 RepID=UPI003867BBCC|nr:alanine and proline-rich secreted protein Apa [Nocardia sp. NBC_00881]